ncbi:MAG TPA: sucrase ferredoxin [Actinomycetes bacterium]|nr:sucrase ferredoxin [Actinomycetes bacterium]
MPEGTCSAVSRALAEPLFATASRVRAWVLVEQTGPWGREALVSSRLDPAVGRALHERGHAAGVRVLLIRRPGRAVPGPRRTFLAHTGRLARWLEELRLEDPAELLGLDWARLGVGEPPGYGVPFSGPLYLACTNGRHDQCCATWGRPLARTLVDVVGDRVWESSHIGGDRFAGNLVCLPEGVYYGRVDAAEASRVVERHERGRLDLEHYRGRCCYPPVVQAAEYFLRREEGLTGIDGVVAEWREGGPGGVVAVRFATEGGGRWLVRLRVASADPDRPLTCQATRSHRPPAYRLLGLARLGGGG